MEQIDHYRKLAATLHQAQRQRRIKIVMVASAVAGEGKSVTAAAVARVLSGSYRRRVLLIDADLRRPVLHIVSDVENDYGLDETLLADGPITELRTVTLEPNLELMTAGRPNPDPIAVLTSPRMRELLALAAERYDWVIVDTPPVALMPDSELLGSIVDAALLVVAAGQTDYRLVTKTVDALGRDRVLGVVLNKVDPKELDATLDPAYGYAYAGNRRDR